MSRPSSLLLPILLSLPLALSAQETTKSLSPALKAKLLAQNTVPPPSGSLPAGAPPAPAAPKIPRPSAPATPAGVPTAVPPPSATEGTPSTDAVPAALPAGAAPSGTNPSGTTPAAVPGSTGPAAATPRPTVPRPSIPLPSAGGTRPGNAIPRAATPRPASGAAAAAGAASRAGDATGTGLEPDPNNPWGDIVLLDADITDVIAKYEEITQRHVIRDKDLQGKVNITANPNPAVPFTRDEAAEFIKAALAIQGFVIQPYNKNIDKILLLNRPPGTEPPLNGSPLYTREQDLPETDDIVNFVLTLKHLPVADASQVFANAVPTHQWTKYVAVPSANSIFIQETVSNIRSLLKVTKSLDLPPVKMVHEWVELERASAEDVQAILDQILQAQTQGKSGSGNSGFRSISPAAAAVNLNQPGGAPQPVVTGSSGTGGSGLMPDGSSVIVKADPRTNRVFINGPSEHVEYLKKLIHEFDEPSRVKNLLTQQIRYIPVNEFFDLALTALEATGAGNLGSASGGGSGGGAAGGGARTTGGRTGGDFTGGGGNDFRSNFNSRSSGNNSGMNGGRTSGGGSGTRSSVGSSGLSGTSNTDPPRAQTVGKTLLVSDPRTNSLIVSGPPDSIQRVSDLVKQMDRRPYQVHINAVIAQMAIGDDLQTSVDFLRKVETVDIFGQAVDAAGFFRSAANGTFIDPSSLTTEAAFPTTGNGFNIYAAAGELFNAYIRAIEATANARLLAKPHITVANNQVGSISSGERVPIPSNQQSTVVAGGTTSLNSSIEYENVVLSLDVQPLINSKNEITLTVGQLNDTVNGTTEINGNAIPNIATQELNTSITIPNGAILVLGGLLSEQERKSNSSIPVIARIPVLKWLVGSNTRNKQRRELLILLQARIIESADDMVDVNVSEIQRTVVGPDAEAFAKPDRSTNNVTLPTFENDIPYNQAGAAPQTEPSPPPRGTTRARIRTK